MSDAYPMSLKDFHIIFIAAAILLSWGFALWCFGDGAREVSGAAPLGGAALLVGVALLFYLRSFIKKQEKRNGNHA